MKRVLKYLAVSLLLLVLLVLIVPAALYIPLVQRVAVKQTLALLNDNTDNIRYDIKHLQLKFPLEIELWDVCVYRPEGCDTLIYVHHLKTALDEFPFRDHSDFVVHQLLVEQAQSGIDTSFVSGLDLIGSLDALLVRDVVLNIDSNAVSVDSILLTAPHFAVFYQSADTVEAEEPDTTASDPWKVRLGALDINDASLHYDQWRIDSLNLHLSNFKMAGMDIHLDTLTADLPESHLGISTDMDLSYLQDTTLGWIRANLDLFLSRADMYKIAGNALPELQAYWPDSTDVVAKMSVYATPDLLQVPSISLAVPGRIEMDGQMQGTCPFDNERREAELALSAHLTHCDSLLSVFVGTPDQRPYRLPANLSISLNASQRRNLYDAVLSLDQDTFRRLCLTADYNQRNSDGQANLYLSQLSLCDYLPDINYTLDKTGIDALMSKDSMKVHADINADLADLGRFDSLQIDFLNATHNMKLDVNAGDAIVGVEAGCDVSQLMDIIDRVLKELDIQTQSKIFDINALQQTIPTLSMQIAMQQNNPIVPFLHQQGVSMDQFSFL